MQILSYVLTGISAVLIVLMLITFRRARAVTLKTPVIAIVVGIVGFLIYKAILGTSLSPGALVGLGVFGALLGLIQGGKTKVWAQDGRRMMQNSFWFIVVWALGYGISQLLVVTGKAMSMNLGIAALGLTTGITLGSQIVLLAKVVRVKPAAPQRLGQSLPSIR